MTRHRWLITALACLLLLVILAGVKFMQIRAAIAFGESFPEPSESVQALVVTATQTAVEVSTLGEIIAPRSVELRNELAGQVVAVNLAPGSRFAKGDLLIQLDVSEETARHQAALARAELARLSLKRQQALFNRGSASQDQLDQARAERDIAEADARQLAALIAKKTLTAPFDGIAGLHHIEPGDYLDANTPLVMLQGLTDSLWVDFSLAPAQADLALGDRVRVAVPDSDGEYLTATLIARDPALSDRSRSLRYRAQLPADPRLPVHAVVDLRAPVAVGEHILLPAQAVLRDEVDSYVYVLEPDGDAHRARRRGVTLGPATGDTVTVVGGLVPGERIATHGAFKLRHGMRAMIRERPGSDAARTAEP